MMTIGILGAGRVGTAVSRAALLAGYSVNLAASGPAEEIALIAEIMTPGATAMTAADAVATADLVVLAVPLHKYRTVAPAVLAGKVVIDVMNYWAPVDGVMQEFETPGRTSSEVIAEFFSGARLVKSLNHIGYHDLETDALPAGTPGRRALAVASDDPAATALALAFIDRLGFDSVDAGPLVCGAAFQPGTTIFSRAHGALEITGELERHAQARAGNGELVVK